MVVFLIAALHCLFPIIGAVIARRQGLIIGTAIGVICSLIFGAIVFTIPDLIGVAFGFCIGLGLIDDENPNVNVKEVVEAIAFVKDKAVDYTTKLFYMIIAFSTLGVVIYGTGKVLYDENFSDEAIQRKTFENTPSFSFYKDCYELKNGKACYEFAFRKARERKSHSQETIQALKFSCDLNYKPACYELPYILFKDKRYLESKEYLKVTCLENYSSCMSHAFTLESSIKNDYNAKPLAIFAFEQIINQCNDKDKLKVYNLNFSQTIRRD